MSPSPTRLWVCRSKVASLTQRQQVGIVSGVYLAWVVWALVVEDSVLRLNRGSYMGELVQGQHRSREEGGGAGGQGRPGSS